MDVIISHPLIKVTKEDVKTARAFYGLEDEKSITECLDAIEEWYQKQPHLAEACKYLTRTLLERIFILSRGSIEGTKKKIEKLLTYRGIMPELTLNRNVEEFSSLFDIVNYVALPKLCKTDQSRVMVTQCKTNKIDEFSLLAYFRYCCMLGEYRLHFDYTLSERFIIDLNNVPLSIITKLNPILVKKAEILCSDAFGSKIKGIHILNAPSFVDRLVFILKQALKEKVASRLHVHSSYDELHKHIPKEILPKDYGGDEESCSKLAEKWKNMLATPEARKIVEGLDKLVSDEQKRSNEKFNEEYMGMPGSFRKLTVD